MVVIVAVFFAPALFGALQDRPFLVIRHGKPPSDFVRTAVTSYTNFILIMRTNMDTGTFYAIVFFQHKSKFRCFLAGIRVVAKIEKSCG